jgi:uncharacterized membrane protein
MDDATDLIIANVHAVAEMERRAIHGRSRLERFTDRVTAAAGSLTFIVLHVVGFAGWMLLNTTVRAIDPKPFTLLNLLVSLEAIILTSFVLMTQNRMTKQADKRGHLDLQVNLLAEQELTATLQMLHALCQRAGVRVKIRHPHVEELLKRTDIDKLSGALDEELKPEQ